MKSAKQMKYGYYNQKTSFSAPKYSKKGQVFYHRILPAISVHNWKIQYPTILEVGRLNSKEREMVGFGEEYF